MRGEPLLRVLRLAQFAEGSIDLTGAIHFRDERSEPFGFSLGRLDDLGYLLDCATRDASEGADLVASLSGIRWWWKFSTTVPRGFLPLFCCCCLGRRQRSTDRVNLAGKKVFPVGILGQFTTRDLVEINLRHWDLGPAKFATGSQAAFARYQKPIRPHYDRMQQPNVSDAASEAGDVAQVPTVALADLHSIEGHRDHRTAPMMRIGEAGI
jgi:hypothetical protein